MPKTKTYIRKLTLPPAVVAVLKEYRQTVDSRGCKRIRFHDLRHVFAILSLQNGMDVKTLSAMLGYVSSATTLDICTKINDNLYEGRYSPCSLTVKSTLGTATSTPARRARRN